MAGKDKGKDALKVKKLGAKNVKEAKDVKGGMLKRASERTDDAMSCSTNSKCCS
jgi:hypothetical protein